MIMFVIKNGIAAGNRSSTITTGWTISKQDHKGQQQQIEVYFLKCFDHNLNYIKKGDFVLE